MRAPFAPSEWTDGRLRSGRPLGVSTAVLFAISVAALYFGREILVPLALAILLSFVLAPLVLLLRRVHVGRVPSVFIAVLLAIILMFGIGALIAGQVAQLADNFPQYQSTINHKIRSLRGTAAGNSIVQRTSSLLSNVRKEMSKATASNNGQARALSFAGTQQAPIPVEIRATPPAPLKVVQNVIEPLLGPLAMTGIVIVFLIFILLQREDLRDRLIRLVGARDLHRTTLAIDDGVRRLSRYFLVQSAVNAAFGLLIGIGLFFIGVPNPVLWGIVAMLLRFIPYIGAAIAAIGPAALSVAVAPGWSTLLWTLGLFLVVEPIMSQLVEPLVYGRSTGLSPVAVVVSAVFWTCLWGPIGLLLSTPLTVCLVVIGRHVEHLQFLDVLFGNQPALAPEESFYQRMLAGDPDEAAHQAETFLKDKSLADYYDEVALKGLALAQMDVERGVLDHEKRVQIKEAVEGLIDDLSNHQDARPVPPTHDGPRGDPLPWVPLPEEATQEGVPAVLCVAGRGSLDEAAAAILAQLLLRQSVRARVVSNPDVSTANISRLQFSGVRLVCLSYLEAEGFRSARYLVRRLRRRLPSAKFMVGLWTHAQEPADPSDALTATEADFIATSLAAAVAQILAEVGGPAGPHDTTPVQSPVEAVTRPVGSPTADATAAG
jgi:predicted PurR-regulated permease PerM